MSLRAILANLALLLLSLGLAVIIWVTAIQEDAPVISTTEQIPVRLVGQRADVDVRNAPESVQISVEGPSDLINALPWEQIVATLDLSDVPFGQSQVPITVAFEQEGVRISEPFPSFADITIEQNVTRDIPVRLDIRGTVARGHASEDPIIEPPTISVSGPASRVDALAEAQVTIRVNDARETLVATLPLLIFRNLAGESVGVSGLQLSTREVQVTVPVTQLAGFADKPVTARWVGEPAPGFRLLNVSVEPSSVLVTGTSVQLELLDRVFTEPIDIEGLTESLTQQVSLDLPEGILQEDIQPFVVTVEIEPILTTDIVVKTPELTGLAEGLTAEVDPDRIRVSVVVPAAILDTFQESNVRVTLDLFGLQAGVHNIAPDVDVTVDEVQIRSWQPPLVTVTISPTLTDTEELSPTLPITTTSSLSDSLRLPPPAAPATAVPAGGPSPAAWPAGLLLAALPLWPLLARRRERNRV